MSQQSQTVSPWRAASAAGLGTMIEFDPVKGAVNRVISLRKANKKEYVRHLKKR